MKVHTGGIPPLVKVDQPPIIVGPLYVVLDAPNGEAQIVADEAWGILFAEVLMELKGPWEAWIVQGVDPAEAARSVEETFEATRKK